MAELIHPTVISNELFARCYRWQVLRHGGDAGSGNPSRQWQKDVDPEGVTHGLEVSGWRRSWLYAVAQRVDKDHWPSACGMSRFRIHALPLDPHPPHVVFIRCGAGGIVARVGMERSVSPHPGPLHEPECARPRAQQDPNWRGARIGSIAGSLLCVAAPGDGRTPARPLTVHGFKARNCVWGHSLPEGDASRPPRYPGWRSFLPCWAIVFCPFGAAEMVAKGGGGKLKTES